MHRRRWLLCTLHLHLPILINAQWGLQMHGQGKQVWDAGEAQQWANHAHGMPAPAQGRGLRGPSKSRQKRKNDIAQFAADPEIIRMVSEKAEFDHQFSVLWAAKKEFFGSKRPAVSLEKKRSLSPALSEKERSDDDMEKVD